MTKKLLLILLIASTAFAASTYTTNYNLEKPADGDTNWGEAIRDGLDTIDSQLYIGYNTANDHINDTSAAHAASAISNTVSGFAVCTTQTTVQLQLACLDDAINDLAGGGAVDLTSNQTITGTKTFATTPIFSALSTGIIHSDSSGVLTSSAIVNADVNASAAIERTKLASGTASHVLINDGSGVMSSEAQLTALRGGTGIDASSAATNQVLAGTGSGLALSSTPTISTITADASVKFGDTGGGSNLITMQAPSDGNLTTDYTLTLPTTDGAANEALITDGSGVLSWGPAGGYPTGSATANISAGGTISITTTYKAQVIYVQGNGAAVSTSSSPFGSSNPGDNSEVVVCGRSNTNTVTISTNDAADGAITNGAVVLGNYDCITFIYNSTDDRFIEKNRSLK